MKDHDEKLQVWRIETDIKVPIRLPRNNHMRKLNVLGFIPVVCVRQTLRDPQGTTPNPCRSSTRVQHPVGRVREDCTVL